MNNALPTNLHRAITKHQGVITRQQALAEGIAEHELPYWAKRGFLTRVQRGVYQLADFEGFEHDYLLPVMLRIPKGVLCLMSALAFHAIGTFVPTEIHLAIPRETTRPKLDYPTIKLHRFSEKRYSYGIEEHKAGSGLVRVYSKEKTLADMLAYRNTYGLALFLEALKDYLAGRNKSTWKLLEAAKVCGVEKLMQEYLTVVLA
jgi:predicted transcriptional regulator of viral defense system